MDNKDRATVRLGAFRTAVHDNLEPVLGLGGPLLARLDSALRQTATNKPDECLRNAVDELARELDSRRTAGETGAEPDPPLTDTLDESANDPGAPTASEKQTKPGIKRPRPTVAIRLPLRLARRVPAVVMYVVVVVAAIGTAYTAFWD